MMAGHSSVKILSGSAWTMLCMNDLLYFIGDLGPLFIVLALTGPELGVAISQAHVSTISICIYLNDATNLHQSGYLFIIEQKRGLDPLLETRITWDPDSTEFNLRGLHETRPPRPRISLLVPCLVKLLSTAYAIGAT